MKNYIETVLAEADYQPVRLLQILRAVQARYQHIPAEAVDFIAEKLKISRGRIIAVAEFYSFFHLTPQGRYDILISDSITDRMLGKENLIGYLSTILKVKVGAVRGDGLVSLNNTSCTGICDQGPAGLVNGYPLTRLDRPKLDEIAALVELQKPLTEWPPYLFEVADNIHKAGLLLNQPVANGAGLNAGFARGVSATLDEIDRSGLRGRGGAGFKTAMKWKFCAEEKKRPALRGLQCRRRRARHL